LHFTRTKGALPFKSAGFETLVEALEYAAAGDAGIRFYGSRGDLQSTLTYRELRDEAVAMAGWLSEYPRGSRVAIIAETDPMVPTLFFACQYAGLLPVALPSSVQLGAHDRYVEQLTSMLRSCGASLAVSPASHITFLREAASPIPGLRVCETQDLHFEASPQAPLQPLNPEEPAYLQYTSGSTSAPRGVEISQSSVMTNLREIAEHGLDIGATDRFVSWLPLYHDMGLVGFLLLPVATQCSVDLLAPRTFAMRPRLWLKLISDNRGTITSSPPFGYALCARRLRPSDTAKYDLSCWRAACVGAERINPQPLRDFAVALADTGFRPESFVACYGMAECALAVSFAPLKTGLEVEVVSKSAMEQHLRAQTLDPQNAPAADALELVDCGRLLPSFEVSIRDPRGREVPQQQCGTVWLRGPSVMRGYFQNPAATASVIDSAGWLNTGDIGYLHGDRIFITARSKDVIIIKGRNIWPQDLERLTEQLPGVRNASAFGTENECGDEVAVLVVESRERTPSVRSTLRRQLAAKVHDCYGIKSFIDLVEPGDLPHTSSGKLSRARAKQDFLARAPAAYARWQNDGELPN